MRIVARIVSWTAGLVPGLAVLALAAYAVLYVAGYRTVAVYSGSMKPELQVGSLAFVKGVDSAEVRVGDVITFQDPKTPGRLITHRVVERFRHQGQLVYRTKGDSNTTVDPWTIALPGTVGRLGFDLPVAGYALVYAKTREVRTGLILLFSGLLLYWLLARIWRAPKTVAAVDASPVVEPSTRTPADPLATLPVAARPLAATSTRELRADVTIVCAGLLLCWLIARISRASKPAVAGRSA